MSFIDDIKPLLGFLRLVAVWIETIVFALMCLADYFPDFRAAALSSTAVLIILDLIVAYRRCTTRKVARILDREYVVEPEIGFMVIDLLFGLGFLVMWVLAMLPIDHIYSRYKRYSYSYYEAYTMIGTLVIAHLHLFFGGVEAFILSRERKGTKDPPDLPSRRRTIPSIDHIAELASPVEGMHRV